VAAIICVLACVPAPAHAEIIDMCDYYPLAVGNLWRADGHASFVTDIEVVAHLTANGFGVWEVSQVSTFGGQVFMSGSTHRVWVDDNLYWVSDPAALTELPTIADGMLFLWSRYYPLDTPVMMPDGVVVTAHSGTLSSLLDNYGSCLGITGFAPGDQADAIALVDDARSRFFVRDMGLVLECMPDLYVDPGWEFLNPITLVANEGCPNPLFLTSTNLGEAWEAGTAQTITWQGDTEVAGPDVRIGLHKGAAFIDWIVRKTANDGEYAWLIPPDLAPGDDYRLRIQSFTDNSTVDYSDGTFSIAPPALALTVPNGGEALQAVKTQTIAWLGDDPAVGADVRLGLHKGATFLGWITRRTSNDGEFNWLIPDDLPAAANYRLRIQSFTDSAIRDFSDRRFAIVR